jgi:iron complex transport system substrate-binding protein
MASEDRIRIVHDWLGPLELPLRPQRIVSLAPNATESLYALGLGERLVGRSAFCYRPQEVEQLPVLASYTKIRWRLLAELQPDLILLSTGVQREILQALREAAYPIFPLPLPQSPWGILENLELLGALLEAGQEAHTLSSELAARYLALRQSLPPLRVYLEFDLGGPITVGRGSYVDAALRHLGLINIFEEVPQSYFAPRLEEVPLRHPELIIYEPKPGRKRARERAEALIRERGWPWPVVVTRGDALAHYGPSFFSYLEELAAQVRDI